jgi:type IV secretion system protein VirB6
MACPANNPDGAFASTLLSYIDCQAQSIGEGGYQALAAPGSTVAIAITGLLVLFVGLFGYRMVLGQPPRTTNAIPAVIKIGLVLTFATNWTAYRTVFYDVTMHGPAEVASQIGRVADISAAQGGLVDQIQRADDSFIELGRLGVGRQLNVVGQGATANTSAAGNAPFLDLSFDRASDASALRLARTSFLLTTIGALAIIRLFAGLLLALGPLFVAFLLFEGTRDLFSNWARGLAWTVIAAVSVTLIVGLELAFLDPWLTSILALRRADLPTSANPSDILALSVIFAVTVFAVLAATVQLVRGLSLAAPAKWIAARYGSVLPQRSILGQSGVRIVPEQAPRSRAALISDAARSLTVREASGSRGDLPQRSQMTVTGLGLDGRRPYGVDAGMTGSGLARSFRRRTRTRVSTIAANRDGAR